MTWRDIWQALSGGAVRAGGGAGGRGLHSSTSQLNVSDFLWETLSGSCV